MKNCTIEGCGKEAVYKTKGLCRKHYRAIPENRAKKAEYNAEYNLSKSDLYVEPLQYTYHNLKLYDP
jgi:hypothetical protein